MYFGEPMKTNQTMNKNKSKQKQTNKYAGHAKVLVNEIPNQKKQLDDVTKHIWGHNTLKSINRPRAKQIKRDRTRSNDIKQKRTTCKNVI